MLLLTMSFFANADVNCRAVKWPYTSKKKAVSVLDLSAIKRSYLYNYLYFELSNPINRRHADLAKKIITYLKGNEHDEDRYNMILTLEWAADLDKSEPRVIPMSEICFMEEKISRDPAAVKSAKKKK